MSRVPAIVTAGDGRAAKAVYGENKAFLEVAGRPLVARIVAVLQQVPEVSEVWVVGNPERLRSVLGEPDFERELTKPLHIVPQQQHLLANAWEAYRRALPGAPAEGRDPVGADRDLPAFFLSADMPFATPHELSEFINRAESLDCDYALGLVPDHALDAFRTAPGTEGPRGHSGIEVAYFNVREGRFRQSNIHWAKPARIGNLPYVEEMYEHRHQREFGKIAALAWGLLRSELGGAAIVAGFARMHFAGVADRWRWHWLADRLRGGVSIPRIEAACSQLLKTNFRFCVTEVGGCAIDVDTDEEYDAVCERFEEWSKAQWSRGEAICGKLPAALPPSSGSSTGLSSAGGDQ